MKKHYLILMLQKTFMVGTYQSDHYLRKSGDEKEPDLPLVNYPATVKALEASSEWVKVDALSIQEIIINEISEITAHVYADDGQFLRLQHFERMV